MKLHLHIKTKIVILLGLIMSFLASPICSSAQPVLKIGDSYNCSNTEVLVPVELENFEDISAFTIFIGLDLANVEYIGIEDINEVFSTGNFVDGVDIQNQLITFNWLSFIPANLESGLLCNISILLKNNSVNFNFLNSCEVVRSDLSVIDDVKYLDGSMKVMSTIVSNPVSLLLTEGNSAYFELVELSNDVTCIWQVNNGIDWVNIIDTPPYSGANTFGLTIQSVTTEMNSSYYRGLLSNNVCSEGSAVSELLVTPLGVEEDIEKTKVEPIKIFPNPSSYDLNCMFNVNVENSELRLVSMEGEVLYKQKAGHMVSGNILSLNVDNISNGTYVLQLFSNGNFVTAKKVLRK